MDIKILSEHGFEEALLGLSLSRQQPMDNMEALSVYLHAKEGGHNKFLESIYLWLDIKAPRYWWQEADTYRLTTKQSESTMYLITKRLLTAEDFYPGVEQVVINALNRLISKYQTLEEPYEKTLLLNKIKANLPEGFLQRRLWVMNYKTLRNIYQQRKEHKLFEWRYFCNWMVKNCQHGVYLGD